MNRRRRLFENTSKIIYEGPETSTLIQHFKDNAGFENQKQKDMVDGRGVLNNRISEFIFQSLNEVALPTHFIRRLNMREQLVHYTEPLPIELIVRNNVSGDLAERLGIEEGMILLHPLIEFYFLSSEKRSELITEDHIIMFEWASSDELERMTSLAFRINDFLTGLFKGIHIRLIDVKLQFGRLWEGEESTLIVTDELSLNTCHLWDIKSKDMTDKQVFAVNNGNSLEGYQEVLRRFGLSSE